MPVCSTRTSKTGVPPVSAKRQFQRALLGFTALACVGVSAGIALAADEQDIIDRIKAQNVTDYLPTSYTPENIRGYKAQLELMVALVLPEKSQMRCWRAYREVCAGAGFEWESSRRRVSLMHIKEHTPLNTAGVISYCPKAVGAHTERCPPGVE